MGESIFLIFGAHGATGAALPNHYSAKSGTSAYLRIA